MIQPHDRIYVAGHRGMVGSACVRAFEKAGFTNGEVALVAGAPWRFDSFTQDDYRTLYEELRTSVLKVDAYSDLDTLPDTPNVTVDRLP